MFIKRRDGDTARNCSEDISPREQIAKQRSACMNRTPMIARGSGVVRGHRYQRRDRDSSLCQQSQCRQSQRFSTTIVTLVFAGANAVE
jgi:hypothetical protein